MGLGGLNPDLIAHSGVKIRVYPLDCLHLIRLIRVHQKNMGRLEASSLQSEEENRPKRF